MNNKGFTIIEVIFAISIFAITLVAAGSMQFNSIRNNRTGNMVSQANMFAKDKIEELINMKSWKLPEGTFSDQSDNGVYTRTWVLSNYTPKSKRLFIKVTWKAAMDRQREIKFSTLLKCPVKTFN
jgi:prepilin-type N-terminal cleavage/methylation domain-containing protein